MCGGVGTNSTDAGFTPFWYMMGVVGVIKHEEGDGWFNWGVGMRWDGSVGTNYTAVKSILRD